MLLAEHIPEWGDMSGHGVMRYDAAGARVRGLLLAYLSKADTRGVGNSV